MEARGTFRQPLYNFAIPSDDASVAEIRLRLFVFKTVSEQKALRKNLWRLKDCLIGSRSTQTLCDLSVKRMASVPVHGYAW